MVDPVGGKLLAGRYRLERQIGRGSMGSVWAGTDDKLRRPVAIKLMTDRAVSYEQALARFEQEAMAVARLRSPYVVQVYDYGLDGQSPFIVMELLEGEDLGSLLKRSVRPLAMAETTRIIVQTAKGLHAAHEAGVVHRDLKPANIFLVEEHGEAVAKVFDFGIAKALSGVGSDAEMTAEGVLLGTPRYMSPEQAHGSKHVDHRTDLWSLAVIAYQCVTGRYPFKGSGLGEIIANICTQPFPPPTELFPYLPVEMDLFFEKALAKEPAERFGSARELGAAFARLTDASIPSLELPVGDSAEISYVALDATRSTRSSQLAGTLGAAAPSPPERSSRRRRLGFVAAALLGLAAGATAWVVTRASSTAGSAGSGGPEVAPSAAVAPSGGEPASTPSAVAEDGGPGSSAAESATGAPSADESSRPTRGGRGSKSTSQATSTTASPQKPTAAPTSKPTGDGLDQFDNRF